VNGGVVVLASGTGSLFQAILNSDIGPLVCSLVTDVPDCGAVDFARSAGIPVQAVPLTGGLSRDDWNRDLATAVAQWNPALIVSAGFMRILGPLFVDSFPNRIINSHPALLPNFPGAHAVRDAISAGATQTGCTIHFVDHGVDTGAIVAQESVDVQPGDTEEILHERIKVVERVLLPATIKELLQSS
jgi:phosphoribosylglycinamide formyltransferase-1